MKPSEMPAEFIVTMIGNLYDRPQMYVRTVRELDSLLYFTHYLWAEIADRREEYLRLGGWEFGKYIDRSELDRLIESTVGHDLHSRDEFQAAIQYWQQVDRRIGINPQPDCVAPRFE